MLVASVLVVVVQRGPSMALRRTLPPGDARSGSFDPARPLASTDPAGVASVIGGDVIRAGATARVVGLGYVTGPPGTDLIYVGVAAGEGSGLVVFKGAASESYLRAGTPGESTRVVERGANDERVNDAFDSVLASLRPLPEAHRPSGLRPRVLF